QDVQNILFKSFLLLHMSVSIVFFYADGYEVIRRNVGQQVTIQCKSTSNQEMLYLKRGLNEEEDIFYLTDLQKSTINQKFTDRLQFHGRVPNVDILLKNLTLDDTGPYWCVYKVSSNYELKASRGNGSVLLVVTGDGPAPSPRPVCTGQSQGDLVLVSVVICAAVLIVVLTVFLIWIIIKVGALM
uniref:Immunoglobulin V-set domain-containing protein n=1 Tax=Haplochromis burtoni TaxID=8153 RepID=A0A3Q2VEX3_HAPBU